MFPKKSKLALYGLAVLPGSAFQRKKQSFKKLKQEIRYHIFFVFSVFKSDYFSVFDRVYKRLAFSKISDCDAVVDNMLY